MFSYHAPVYEVEAKPIEASSGSQAAFKLPETKEISEDKKTQAKGVGTAAALASADESNAQYNDGTYTGSAIGFGGSISVAVTIKDGKIQNIRIVSASKETPSYFAKAKAVLARILSKQSTNVDIVSGATYSSNGLILAVRNALKQAAKDPSAVKEETPVKKPSKDPGKSPNEHASKKPPKGTDVSQDGLTDGVYTASGEGWGGTLKLQITVKGGKMTDIKVLSHQDTPK